MSRDRAGHDEDAASRRLPRELLCDVGLAAPKFANEISCLVIYDKFRQVTAVAPVTTRSPRKADFGLFGAVRDVVNASPRLG